MPTLIRLLVFLFVVGVIGAAAMLALAYLVTPTQREITVEIAPERLRR